MIKIVDNCCSLKYLDSLKETACASDNWNFFYPMGEEFSIEDKFPKLDIIVNGNSTNHFLAGLALGLLLQIYEASGHELFIPSMYSCGISIKDKHRTDNIHTDFHDSIYHGKIIKILGIINSDWEEEWGGGFVCNEKSTYAKPTSFWIFDPSESHSAAKIITDKKRFVIDFSVFKDTL